MKEFLERKRFREFKIILGFVFSCDVNVESCRIIIIILRGVVKFDYKFSRFLSFNLI